MEYDMEYEYGYRGVFLFLVEYDMDIKEFSCFYLMDIKEFSCF